MLDIVCEWQIVLHKKLVLSPEMYVLNHFSLLHGWGTRFVFHQWFAPCMPSVVDDIPGLAVNTDTRSMCHEWLAWNTFFFWVWWRIHQPWMKRLYDTGRFTRLSTVLLLTWRRTGFATVSLTGDTKQVTSTRCGSLISFRYRCVVVSGFPYMVQWWLYTQLENECKRTQILV